MYYLKFNGKSTLLIFTENNDTPKTIGAAPTITGEQLLFPSHNKQLITRDFDKSKQLFRPFTLFS